MNDSAQWLTFEDAVRASGVPAATIRSWFASGRIDSDARGGRRLVRLDQVNELARRTARDLARQDSTLRRMLRAAATGPDRLEVSRLQEQVRARS